jgi:D-cysteine desulfhydrase
MPRGGATALGAIGYALAAAELHEQLARRGLRDVRVIVPVGSGGTLAGLIAGHVLLGRPWTLVGCSASRPPQAVTRQVLALARQCLSMLGPAETGLAETGLAETGKAGAGPGEAIVADARGPGHGLPSAEGTVAAEQALRTEGLMVDPVYTAKALALVPRYCGAGNVDFWHTGGLLDAVAAATAEGRP